MKLRWLCVFAAGCTSVGPESAEAEPLAPSHAEPQLDPTHLPPPRCLVDPDPYFFSDFEPPPPGAKPPGADFVRKLGAAPSVLRSPEADLQQAAQGVCAEPMVPKDDLASPSGAQALLGDGGVVALCCGEAHGGGDIEVGCMHARKCSVVYPDGDGYAVATTVAELGAAMAPIDSQSKAIGLVGFANRWAWLPYAGEAADSFAAKRDVYAWEEHDPARAPLEVEENDWGWVVRVPSVRTCGCQQHLVRVAYRVDRSGEVCRTDEPPVPLLHKTNRICID